jgi:hypothetical protein
VTGLPGRDEGGKTLLHRAACRIEAEIGHETMMRENENANRATSTAVIAGLRTAQRILDEVRREADGTSA